MQHHIIASVVIRANYYVFIESQTHATKHKRKPENNFWLFHICNFDLINYLHSNWNATLLELRD